MTPDDKLLAEIVNKILNVVRPRRIILFGSAAMGEMTRESDIDLLVIEEGIRSEREEGIRLRVALRDLDVPVDVFAMNAERFEETKGVMGGLAYPANKYGKVIYEAA